VRSIVVHRDLKPANVFQAAAGVVEDVAIAFDSGLARAGYAVARLLPCRTSVEPFELLALGCWQTEKSDRKRAVLAADDDFRRAREQAARLAVVVRLPSHRIRYVAAEAMSFPRNARSSAQIAMFWGALAFAMELHALPLVQASPQEIRARLGVEKKEPKAAVHLALERRFGAHVIGGFLRGLNKEERNHPLDALAALVASEGSDIFRLSRPI
jgi:Holliday junction resolvasome RuvABC endonuclease subunit